jgi:hypothetical protein
MALFALSLLMLTTWVVPTIASAQGIELGDSVVAEAEVVAIDRVDRTVTLRGAEGAIVKVEVSHAARNFDQIEVGDRVRVEYYESIALYLGKPGEKPETAAGMVAGRSPKGDKPAGVVVEAVDVSAKVLAIDMKKGTVTLELPDGSQVTTRADKSSKDLEQLKVGDTIHARYTEAVAISVEKP